MIIRRMLALALLVLLTAPSLADGVSRKPSRLAVSAPADEGYKWTGLYFGGAIGHLWSNERRSDPHQSSPYQEKEVYVPKWEYEGDNRFFFGELKAGYDMELGNGLVAGVFGTWSPNSMLGTSAIDDMYSVGGRFGYAGPNLFVYVGGAWVRMEGADVTLDGWYGLVGFEKPLFNTQGLNLTWGLEYKYQDVEGSAGLVGVDDVSHSALARVNVRFGGFGLGR